MLDNILDLLKDVIKELLLVLSLLSKVRLMLVLLRTHGMLNIRLVIWFLNLTVIHQLAFLDRLQLALSFRRRLWLGSDHSGHSCSKHSCLAYFIN